MRPSTSWSGSRDPSHARLPASPFRSVRGSGQRLGGRVRRQRHAPRRCRSPLRSRRNKHAEDFVLVFLERELRASRKQAQPSRSMCLPERPWCPQATQRVTTRRSERTPERQRAGPRAAQRARHSTRHPPHIRKRRTRTGDNRRGRPAQTSAISQTDRRRKSISKSTYPSTNATSADERTVRLVFNSQSWTMPRGDRQKTSFAVCCIGRGFFRARQTERLGPDGRREFVERGRDAKANVGFDSEFVVALLTFRMNAWRASPPSRNRGA
jgi:hypothetical protein